MEDDVISRDELMSANLELWNKLVRMICEWEDEGESADDLACDILRLPELAPALDHLSPDLEGEKQP